MRDWRDSALCAQADPALWYPDKGGPSAQAKAICRRCPVRVECLEHTLATEPASGTYGIAGGLTAEERTKLRRSAA